MNLFCKFGEDATQGTANLIEDGWPVPCVESVEGELSGWYSQTLQVASRAAGCPKEVAMHIIVHPLYVPMEEVKERDGVRSNETATARS
jgi:hypothetical protein